MWSRALRADWPINLFLEAGPGSWAQKWGAVGDTVRVENLFPFFAALGRQ